VTNVETLGGESIGLHFNICAGDGLQEGRFADVGETSDNQCACVGVDRRQTAQMLPDLLEVDKRVLEALADCGHATQGRLLQLFALEKRLSVLEQTDVVTRNGLDQRLRSRQLTESNAEVVRIVKGVQQIAVERVDILEAREGFDRGGEALGESLRGVLDFTCVEGSDTADLETCANLCTKIGQHSTFRMPRTRGQRVIPVSGVASGSSRGQCPGTPGSSERREYLSTGSSWWRREVWC
jgi:hypothetical protein